MIYISLPYTTDVASHEGKNSAGPCLLPQCLLGRQKGSERSQLQYGQPQPEQLRQRWILIRSPAVAVSQAILSVDLTQLCHGL